MLQNTKTMGIDGTHARRFIPTRSCSYSHSHSHSHSHWLKQTETFVCYKLWIASLKMQIQNAVASKRKRRRRFSFHYSDCFAFQLSTTCTHKWVHAHGLLLCFVCFCHYRRSFVVIVVAAAAAALVVATVLCSLSVFHSLTASMRKKGNVNV